MTIRAGALRHRIIIEQGTPSQNDFGEETLAWSTLATVWAKKEDLSGNELFHAQQVNAEVTTQFQIRHRGDVTAKMRINLGGTFYNVLSPQDPDGRGRELLLLCSRNVN